MGHLGVELHPEQPAGGIGHRRHRGVLGPRQHFEAGWRRIHPVAVAHPADQVVVQAGKERARAPDPQLCLAKLPLCARRHLSPELAGHQLHPVADAQDRHTLIVKRRVDARRARRVDAVRAPGEHDPPRAPG